MSKPKTMMIDDVQYIRADSVAQQAESADGLPYCIVRCDCSGVYAGYVADDMGKMVTIHKARKLWYWSGAATLSQLAMEGVKKPDECKFPCELPSVSVRDCIEIIPATVACRESISGVKVWEV